MADNQPKYNTKRVLKRYKIIGFVFGFVGLLILIKAGYLMTTVNFWPPHCRNIASTSTLCRGNPIPHAA